MKDLAPEITRQRLLIEGNYSIEVQESNVREYLLQLAAELDLRTYGEPIIHSPEGTGKDENQGFDAFIPLIDSGISIYVWSSARFLAVVLFTCKAFDSEAAIAFTENYFSMTESESKSF